MKKIITAIFLLFLSVPMFAQNKADTSNDSKKLPSLNLLTTDSTWYNLRSQNSGKDVAIIYFNPDCGHCQSQANEIAANLDKLKNMEILWISSMGSIAELKNFQQMYHLTGENIRFLKDQNFDMAIFYDIRTLPFIAIYDKNGEPKKVYRKAITSEGFVAALQ